MNKITRHIITLTVALLLGNVANAQFEGNGFDNMTVQSCDVTSTNIEPECSSDAIVSYLSQHPGGSLDLFKFLTGTYMSGTPGAVNATYEDSPVIKGFCDSKFTRVYRLSRYYGDTYVKFTHTVNYTIEHKYDGPGSVDTYHVEYDEVIDGVGIRSLPKFDEDDARTYIIQAGWVSKLPCGRFDRLVATNEDVFDRDEGGFMIFKRIISCFDACSSLDICKVEITYKMQIPIKVAGRLKNEYFKGDIFDRPEPMTTIQELIGNGLNVTYPNDKISSLTLESSDHWNSSGLYWERTYTITNPYSGEEDDYREAKVKQDLILLPNFARQFDVETEPVESDDPEKPDGKIWILFSSYDMGPEVSSDDPRYWYKIRLTKLDDHKVEEFDNLYDNEYEKVVVDGGNIRDHYWKVLVKDDCEQQLYDLEVLTSERTQHLSSNGDDGITINKVVFKTTADVSANVMKVHVDIQASSDGPYWITGKEYVFGRVVHYMHLKGDGTFVASGTCDEISYDNVWQKHNHDGACGFVANESWKYDFKVMQGDRKFAYEGRGKQWIENAIRRWQNYGYTLMGDNADLILVELKAGVRGTIVAEATGIDDEGNERTLKSKPKIVYHGVLACSDDPNQITGPVGYGDEKMIAAKDRIDYRIDFENDTTATASAGRVVVHCPLHHRADSTTVRLGHFGFGDYTFEVPSLSAYYDNRITETADSLGVWVDVTAGLDIENNDMYWIFQSIDPKTGVAPIDTVGFLPVNDTITGKGEGYVTFSVAAMGNTVTGDTIAEQATITFDDNEPMATNVYVNKFDAVAPVSQMWCDTTGVFEDYTLKFKTLAVDDEDGSGINTVYLYTNVDKTQYVFAGTFAKDSISDTLRCNYKLGQGSLYWFVSQAIDNVGNEEPFRTTADFEFENNNPPMDIFLTKRMFKENASDSTEVGKFYAIDDQSSESFEYTLIEGDGDVDNDKFAIKKDKLLTHHDFRCYERDTFNIRVSCVDAAGGELQKRFKLFLESTETPEITEIDGYVCYGETFTFNDRELTEPGVYNDTLYTTLGCDSIVRLYLYQNPYPELTLYDTIHCIGEDFYLPEFDLSWDSIEKRVTKWSQITDTLLVFRNEKENDHGCFDSLQLSMHLYPVFHDYHDVELCANGIPFFYGDSLFTESCVKDVHFKSEICGCDSIVTVSLDVHPTYYNIPVDTTICSNDVMEIFGQEFNIPGNYNVFGGTAIHHCDSMVLLTLHTKPIAEKYLEYTVCPTDLPQDDYYGFNLYKNITSGLYYDTLDAKNGCDSIVTLDLTVREAETQLSELADGWYWYSTYLDLNEIDGLQALEDSLGEKGLQIKSNTEGFVANSPGMGWVGSLTAIENERMYMIQTNDSVDVDIFSCLTTGSDHPITIVQGWNWIGYVSRYTNSTVNALGTLTPQDGDIIKSYDQGFAAYYEMLGGWFGSLTQMQPGVGYMYYSNNANNMTLVYPEPAKDGGSQLEMLPTHWNASVGKYPTNMTFIGKITIDNIPTTTDNLEVGVFCDGEVRGSGRAILMEGLGTYRLFVQVYGDNGDELTFKLYDHKTGREHDAKSYQKVYFADNASYGSIHDPYPFKFYTKYTEPDNDDVTAENNEDSDNGGNVTNEEGKSHELTLVPNPAKSSHRVLLYCDFTAEERNGLVVEVFNDLGVKIQQIEPTRYPVQLNEIEHAGNYMVRVTTGTGRTLTKKLVVTR